MTLENENLRYKQAQNKLKAFSSNPLYKGINDKGYMNPLSNGKISSTFGLRASPGNGGSSNHKGLDIAAPSGTIISAIKGGEVKTSGYLSGYGNTVVVVTPDGMEIIYAHMLEPSSLKVGDKISIGDTIGKVGSTGNSTGSHLHLGMKKMGVWYALPKSPGVLFSTRRVRRNCRRLVKRTSRSVRRSRRSR